MSANTQIALPIIYTNAHNDVISAENLAKAADERRKINLLEMAMEAANAGFWSMEFATGKFTYSDSVLSR